MKLKHIFESILSKKMYHGSDKIFNNFTIQKSQRQVLMSFIESETKGFFFTPSIKFAKTFGNHVYSANITIKKPAHKNKEIVIQVIKSLFKENVETSNGLLWYDDYQDDSWYNKLADNKGIDWMLFDNDDFIRLLKNNGIDGSGVWEDNGSISYVVFDVDQISDLERIS